LNGVSKLVLGAVALVVALSLLLVLQSASSGRARSAHCRNNLRGIGQLAQQNWNGVDPSRKGREFWQAVRELRYKPVRGDWHPPYDARSRAQAGPNPRDPFLCPVHGRTASDPASAAAIDYRGPKSLREDLRQLGRGEPLGADRPGNHPDGGHVLRLDTSVEHVPSIIDAARGADPLWAEAERFLRD
jgi:hypothetical protein